MFSLLGMEPTEVVLGLPPLPMLALFPTSRKLLLTLEARPEPLLPSEFLLAAFPPLVLTAEPFLLPESRLLLNLKQRLVMC